MQVDHGEILHQLLQGGVHERRRGKNGMPRHLQLQEMRGERHRKREGKQKEELAPTQPETSSRSEQ
jgi:hypothetical protein